MSTLICGSVAYDTIMVFPGRFKDAHPARPGPHPERRLPRAGDASRVRRLRRQHRLQPAHARRRAAAVMATVGDDAQPYLERLDALGISRRFVRSVAGSFTRAGVHHHRPRRQPDHGVPPRRDVAVAPQCRAGRLARSGSASSPPDGRDGMLQHAQQFAERGIPFIFDPGQGLPMFGEQDLAGFIERAHYVAVNDYERGLIVRQDGPVAREHRAPGRGPDRDARRQWLAHPPREWRDARRSRRPGAARSSIRPAAATPIAPACCTACRRDSDWGTTGRLAARWARSRSRTPARRTTRRPLADRRALPRGLRLPPLVRSRRVSRCGREPATGR